MTRIDTGRFLYILLLSFWFFPGGVLATDPQTAVEIDHLLMYLRQTDCTFIRNGEKHSTEEALAHVIRKYRYFKNKIDSAETFITLCASKSTTSGKPYRIKCIDGDSMASQTWFMDELGRFRKNQSLQEQQ